MAGDAIDLSDLPASSQARAIKAESEGAGEHSWMFSSSGTNNPHPDPARRTLAAGLLGLGLSPALAGDGPKVVQGERTWSESAMVLYFDPAVKNGFSLRISRYPERNATWVWCHLLLDGSLYAFTTRVAPCESSRTDPDQPTAFYTAPGLRVGISRLGTSSHLQALSFQADVRAHQNSGGQDGDGPKRVKLEGIFRPGPLKTGSPKGRFERTGRIEARLQAGGRIAELSGVGKAHEQTQTEPRFTAPFTYAMLWGPSASLVGLMSPERQYGDFEFAGLDTKMTSFQIGPWAQFRKFEASLADGRQIRGEAETVRQFKVPIFGRQWLGRIVRAKVEGQSMVGMINDWRPEDQAFR